MAQAVVAVGMVLSRAAIRDLYPQDKAASMIGYVTMGMAVVPMIGPAVGGILDELFGWKANFWLLLLLGLAAWALVRIDFGETARKKAGSPWRSSSESIPNCCARPGSGAIRWPRACRRGGIFAYLGGAPFVGTEVFGMSPGELGFYFGAPAVGYFLGNFISGRFSVRFGVNRMVMWGCWANGLGITASLLIMLSGGGSAITFFSAS
ncbi:MFS transporter [Jhaorihella thermophila]